MPGNNEAIHPILKNKITFTEKDHSYIDDSGKSYISVTTLIGKAFPEFDAEKIAERCSISRGIPKEDLLKSWKENGINAARMGTRLHEVAEHYILNELDKIHEPENEIEKIKFEKVIKIIDNIKKKYNPISMEPEKLVFSPSFQLAGSIDLLVKVNEFNYFIFDWKNLKKDVEKESWGGKTGHILPTLNIPDSNYWHYALQLQIYENILKSENYVSINSNFKKFLIVWNGLTFKIEKIDYIPEAWTLMLWKNKLFSV